LKSIKSSVSTCQKRPLFRGPLQVLLSFLINLFDAHRKRHTPTTPEVDDAKTSRKNTRFLWIF
jgi:hypothetical protein